MPRVPSPTAKWATRSISRQLAARTVPDVRMNPELLKP